MKGLLFIFCILFISLFAVSTSPSHAAGVIQLPATGQTVCWGESGMNDCAPGQDGAIQAGTPWSNPRFIDNGDGTITDNLTQLIWLKNANCFGAQDWTTALNSANTVASGACGLTDGSSSGQWRLPNRKELISLINRQEGLLYYWLNNVGFSNVQYPYWSSSTCADSTGWAWVVDTNNGIVGRTFKSNVSYVWPVRDIQ